MEKIHKKEFSTIENLIEKAKLVGFDTVPESTTALEAKIARIFQETGKHYTAQAIHGLLPEKPAKYFSDKLWYMARKGTLEMVTDSQGNRQRGWYRWGGNPSS